MENARGLGRHLAGRMAASGERVVDVPPKLSARVRVLSSGNARKNDGLDALATALAASRNERLAAMDPEAEKEVLGLTPVGGHIRVSDVNVDEGSHNGAGSNTALYTRVQSRGCSAGPLCHRQTSLPDSQGTWRLGQCS